MLSMLMMTVLVLALLVCRRELPCAPRWWQLGLLATLIQLPVMHWGWSEWLLRLAYVQMLLVAWANRQLVGGPMIVAGIVLNALPILIYGRMPIDEQMVRWGQLAAVVGAALPASKDMVVADTPLLLLGDILPLDLGLWRSAWSIGDVCLCLGLLRYCLGRRTAALARARIA